MTWYEEAIVKGWSKNEELAIKKPINNAVIQESFVSNHILNRTGTLLLSCPVCGSPNEFKHPIDLKKEYKCGKCHTIFEIGFY